MSPVTEKKNCFMRRFEVEKTVNGTVQRKLEQMISPLCSLLAVMALTAGVEGCKPQPEMSSATTLSAAQDSDDSVELLTAKQNTVLKSNLLQSGSQAEGAVCPIPEGTLLTLDAIKPEGIDHWRVFRLTAIKLPTGEIGRRAAAPIATATASSATEGAQQTAPQVQAQVPLHSPQSNLQLADERPQAGASQPVATPSAVTQKTPAQLLNCSLLDADSFLVFSPHFSRQITTAQRSVKQDSVVSDGAAQSSDDGAWMWPTRGRKIRNDAGGSGYFNAPRASGHGHQGIDIIAAVGEPVVAARAGTIIDPAWDGAYGNVMDVQHQSGYLSRYAHLSAFSYSHGAYVEKGTRIAASGRTGNASGYGITPHLHFEIRRNGGLLNPLSLLPE